jgi:hypothetical protein
MAVPVRYRAVPERIQSYLSVWLVLNPPPPAPVGFVPQDSDTGRWVALNRGDWRGVALRDDFTDRRGAAEWLFVAGVGGFRPALPPALEVAA